MNINIYDLTKASYNGDPKRFYFGLLPYINITWAEDDVMVFIGMWQFAIVIKHVKI